MRSQLFTRLFVAVSIAVAVSIPSAAAADPLSQINGTRSAANNWEMAYLGLSAIDAAETISCLDRGRCTEWNPIWGRHPSTTKIIAAKLGLGLIHFATFKYIADRAPKTALRVAQVSAGVQGSAVLLNARLAF